MKLINKILKKSIQELELFNIKKDSLFEFIPYLKFMVAFCSQNHEILDNPGIKELLRYWFWNTLLFNRYPGSQNERVERDFKNIDINKIDKSKEIIKKERTKTFNHKELIEAYYDRKNEQLYLALTTLFININPKDFYSGIELSTTSKNLEEHHIFPYNSKFAKNFREINSNEPEKANMLNNIANIVLLTDETNNKIKKQNPSQYITNLEKKYEKYSKRNDFIRIMDSQLITESMIELLKEDKFEEFIIERTKLIISKINEFCT